VCLIHISIEFSSFLSFDLSDASHLSHLFQCNRAHILIDSLNGRFSIKTSSIWPRNSNTQHSFLTTTDLSVQTTSQMQLTTYRMWRNGDDDRSRSPRNRRRLSPSPAPDMVYDTCGNPRRRLNYQSAIDRLPRDSTQSCRLPPIAAMKSASSSFPSSRNQAAQPQTNGSAGFGASLGLSSPAMNDTEMTSPEHLESQYEDQNLRARASSQTHMCSCNRRGWMTQTPSPIEHASAAYHAIRPYTRISVNGFLNHPETLGTQAQTWQNSTTANLSLGNDFDHPMVTPPNSSTTSSENSSSSISSDSDLRPPFSLNEECYFRLNTLYHICLDASSTYINSLLPYSGRAPAGTTSWRRRTLMDNIRDIATHMWRRARSDGIAPHRAEADAVQAMRDLYAWSMLIIQGMDSDDARDDINSISVARNAMELCVWLGDERAWRGCDGILRELKDLTKMEAMGDRINEVDDDSLGGNIT